MAKTSTFGYSNKEAGTNTVTPLKLGLTTNYALMRDSADVVDLNNKTAPIDQEEIISFRSREVQNIPSTVTVNHPSTVKKGMEYGIKIEEVLKTVDSTDASFEVDDPITMTLAIRHKKSGYVTGAVVAEVFLRMVSSLMKEDGTWRFDDLMRSAERPVED